MDVTIQVPGNPPVKTTTEAIMKVADAAQERAGRVRIPDEPLPRAANEAPATKFAKDQLKSIIERIERLDEERKTISDDIRDVYAEAKQDDSERAEQETILETYMQALGML